MTEHLGSEDAQPVGSRPADAPYIDPRPGRHRRDEPAAPAAAPSPAPARLRVRRRVPRTSRRRRRVLRWGLPLVGAVVLLALGWLLVTGLLARSELDQVRSLAARLRTEIVQGHVAAARSTAHELRAHAHRARSDTSGPAWATAAAVPLLGAPADSVRAITAAVDRASSSALPTLVRAATALRPQSTSSAGGRADLAPALRMLPLLPPAAAQAQAALAGVRAAPASTWLGPVDSARAEVVDELSSVSGALSTVAEHRAQIRTVLGGDGPRTYLVVFQNDAEIRPTGGIGGSYAVLSADRGRLGFTGFYSDQYLSGLPPIDTHLGPQFRELYQNAAQNVQDANSSPDFPTDAQIYAGIWKHRTGGSISGVLALDPTTLSYLLDATGPVTAVDGQQVSAANVVSLTQQSLYQQYAKPSENGQRKRALLDIAQAVAQHLLASRDDVLGVGTGLRRAAGEHRLLFWSRDPGVQHWVESGTLGGALPHDSRPYAAVTLNNNSQSKLDYYLHGALRYRSVCKASGRTVTATVTLRNEAPAGLPAYVEPAQGAPGTEQLYVGMYITRGARFTTVTDNGAMPFRLVGTDQGHPAYLVYATIPAGRTHVVVFHWREPSSDRAPTIRLQPMINPMSLHQSSAGCG